MDREIVIKIPEEYYEIIKHEVSVNHNEFKPFVLIANGTPLPKGHGRLIDADAEIKKIQDISDRVKNRNAPCLDVYDGAIAAMQLAPTIIEAEKGAE